jgi:hypothetical protein
MKSTVIVNGQLTDWFEIERGCRQGDPISPYLFVLSVEVLGIMIRENKDIKGIEINNVEHKILQYADDTESIQAGDKKTFEATMQVLDKFGKRSGLLLNTLKTNAVWLGSSKNSHIKYMAHLGMQWNPYKYKVLGIWFTSEISDCANINYREKLGEVKRLFQMWLKRQITPLGRVAILKSLILSKLTYLWILLPNPPDDFIQSLQKLCNNFVWKGNDKISRKIAQRHVKEGGIGIPNIKVFIDALKLTWIRKFFQTNHNWRHIVLVNYPFLDDIRHYGPEVFHGYKKKNAFWGDVFCAYSKVFYNNTVGNVNEALSEPICFNKRIQIGNAPLKRKDWIRRGLRYIGDFFGPDGKLYDYEEFTSKYTFIDFISFIGICKSIKKFLLNEGIKEVENNVVNKNACLKLILSINKGSQCYYRTLMNNSSRPKCCSKWEDKLGNNNINWKICFYKISKIQDIKMKWFQLRITHRIIGTNIVLKNMGISQSEFCTFCTEDRESINHLFWQCRYIQTFWHDFNELINEKCENAININVSETFIILGHDSNIACDDTFYFIVLFAKQYLYHCRMNAIFPNIGVFRRKLANRFKIEVYNAKVNCLFPEFSAKWACYSPIVSETTHN